MKQNNTIKTPLFFLIFFIISNFQINAQLAFQGFESSASDTWAYTSDPVFYDLGNDFWEIRNSTDQIMAYNGNFVGGEDLENTNNSTGLTILTFDSVAISGESTVSFYINYKGYDSGDYITLEVMYDNGSDWSTPDYSLDINAFGTSGSLSNWELVSHTILSGNSHVRMRIVIFQNGSDEIGLDEFKLEAAVLNTHQAKLKESIHIFPNPFTDKFQIERSAINGIKKLMLYDISGAFLKFIELENEFVNLSTLASGVYFLKIETDKGIITKKVIKN